MALLSHVNYYSLFFSGILIDWADEITSSEEKRPNNWEGFLFDYCLLIVMEILISHFLLSFFKTFLLFTLCTSNCVYLYILYTILFFNVPKSLRTANGKNQPNLVGCDHQIKELSRATDLRKKAPE